MCIRTDGIALRSGNEFILCLGICLLGTPASGQIFASQVGFNISIMPPVFQINSNQRVIVCGRQVIENISVWAHYCIDKDFVLISARDRYAESPDVDNPFLKDALFLCFDDIDEDYDDYVCMTQEQAEQVVDFVGKNKTSPLIICQCEAGISRSGAMAAAVVWYLTGNDSQVWDNRYLYPNRHIYRLLVNEFKKRGCKHIPDFGKKSPLIEFEDIIF